MPANQFLKNQVTKAQEELLKKQKALGKVVKSRTLWLVWLSIFFLIYPGCVVTSLVLAPVHDAVPAWYGWLLRLLLLILWVIACLIVWKKYHDPIAEKQEKVDKAREELTRCRKAVEKADAL
jgi:uncharacterized membrane protein